MMVCPACGTPLTEPVRYAYAGLFVRGRALKIMTLDNGRKSAVWTCRRCGQMLEMGEDWARAAEKLYSMDVQPRVVAGIKLMVKK